MATLPVSQKVSPVFILLVKQWTNTVKAYNQLSNLKYISHRKKHSRYLTEKNIRVISTSLDYNQPFIDQRIHCFLVINKNYLLTYVELCNYLP